jgi:hypothetical protein
MPLFQYSWIESIDQIPDFFKAVWNFACFFDLCYAGWILDQIPMYRHIQWVSISWYGVHNTNHNIHVGDAESPQ